MDLTNIIRKDFVKVDLDTKISEIVGKMLEGEEAVVVCDGNDFIGIISANELIDRDYPIETKAKTLVRKNIPKMKGEIDFIKAAKMFLENGVKAIPVFSKNELIGLLYEKDFIRNPEYLKETNKTTTDIASVPEVVKKDDSIGKARTIIKENNVSRLPVVDEEGKLVGMIDIKDFLKTVNPKESVGRKDSIGDSVPESKLSVTTIMNSNPLFVEGKISCKKAIKLFKKHDTSYVLITKEKEPVGIITSKDILETIASLEKKEGVYVQITGLGEVEDSFDKDKIDAIIEENVKKIGKVYGGIEYLFLHIKSNQKKGKQKLYSIRTRILTPAGLYVSKSSGWNLITNVDEAFDRLERQIIEEHEKHRDLKRPKKHLLMPD